MKHLAAALVAASMVVWPSGTPAAQNQPCAKTTATSSGTTTTTATGALPNTLPQPIPGAPTAPNATVTTNGNVLTSTVNNGTTTITSAQMPCPNSRNMEWLSKFNRTPTKTHHHTKKTRHA